MAVESRVANTNTVLNPERFCRTFELLPNYAPVMIEVPALNGVIRIGVTKAIRQLQEVDVVNYTFGYYGPFAFCDDICFDTQRSRRDVLRPQNELVHKVGVWIFRSFTKVFTYSKADRFFINDKLVEIKQTTPHITSVATVGQHNIDVTDVTFNGAFVYEGSMRSLVLSMLPSSVISEKPIAQWPIDIRINS